MKVFFDTNVILDIILKREPHHHFSDEVLQKVLETGHTPIISGLSIANINYTAKKGVGGSAAFVAIGYIIQQFEISKMDSAIISKAHMERWEDFEDAIQYFSALEAGADIIVTRDVKGYEAKAVKVVEPREALGLLQD